MAWYNSLSDLTGDVKKGVVGVGHVAGEVASNPLVDAGLGAFFGPEAAAAAGGIGRLLAPGGNLGNAAVSGLEGYAAGKAGQLVKGGVTGLLGSTGSPLDRIKAMLAGGTAAAGLGGGSNPLSSAAASLFGGGTGSGGGMSAADLAKLGLLGGSVAAAAADRQRQTGLQDKAVGYATGAYDEKAPLRAQAIAALEHNNAPDLSSIFQNQGNVYDAQKRGTLAPMPPSAASTLTGGNALSQTLGTKVPMSGPGAMPSGALGAIPPLSPAIAAADAPAAAVGAPTPLLASRVPATALMS
jgi:hypothetical protein